MVRQRSHCGFIGCWTKGGKYVAPESLLPYLAQQIHSLGHSVQQRWITGSQINGGIQNSETQPPKQSRDVLHVRKIMMYQQPLHQQHIPTLHQGHFVTCKLITYRCPLVKEKLTFGSNRQVLKMGKKLIQQGVLQLHILLMSCHWFHFPDGDYQIALTQIKVPTSQDR